MRPRAFTLLELLAVIAILGMIGSAVGVSVQQAAKRSRIVTAVQRVGEFDSICRRLARAHDGGLLTFDTAADRASFIPDDSSGATEEISRAFPVDLESISIGGTPALLPEIVFNHQGVSETYVVVFAGSNQHEPIALHIAGGTGHVTRLDHPADAMYMPY